MRTDTGSPAVRAAAIANPLPGGLVESLGPDLRWLRFVAGAAAALLALAGFALAGLMPDPWSASTQGPPAWLGFRSSLGLPERAEPWLLPLAVALATGLLATGAALALPVRSVSRRVALRPVHGHRRSPSGAGPAAKRTGAAGTAAALESLVAVPGTRIFHGLRIPGEPDIHVDHAVLNGGRLVLVESVVWPPGKYRWVNDREMGQASSRRTNVRPVRVADLHGNRTVAKLCKELRVQIAVWPESSGTVEFTPGEEVSPGGVHVGGAGESVAAIRAWLAAGELAGHVDRAIVARLRRMLE
ncbi:hypothetical protein GCM10023081_25270 [Arthrobacter ginkgonis]|uniref:NERD domain-containing protein n=1 Tax=Arthrobacter ginkgonis TaxID=1630594 RepID=A0ABP7CH20_9MICC